MTKIVKLKYKDGKSIVVHMNTFMGLVNQLVVAKFPLDDVVQALSLLCTLPNIWENLVVSLSASCLEENFSLQVVRISILNEERSMIEEGVLSQSEANVAQYLNIGRSKQRSSQKRDKSHTRSKSRGKLACSYCGKLRDFQKDRRLLKKDKGVSNDAEPRTISEEKGT